MSCLSQLISGLVFVLCLLIGTYFMWETTVDPWEKGWLNVTIVSAVSDQPSYERSPPNLYVEIEARTSIRGTTIIHATKAPVYWQTLTFSKMARRDPVFLRLRDAASDSKPIRGQTVVSALDFENGHEFTILLNQLNRITLILTWFQI